MLVYQWKQNKTKWDGSRRNRGVREALHQRDIKLEHFDSDQIIFSHLWSLRPLPGLCGGRTGRWRSVRASAPSISPPPAGRLTLRRTAEGEILLRGEGCTSNIVPSLSLYFLTSIIPSLITRCIYYYSELWGSKYKVTESRNMCCEFTLSTSCLLTRHIHANVCCVQFCMSLSSYSIANYP